ncbi:13693_t:CDS:2 [Ambispora leptoticha]|uniref:13693_t:CDS:1 n=1 Tax=Ambispora leptoticha TaxID=144679 RepID=A0A9N8Z7T7_9GLOM|nr:13693_t:CDS:2 [Ambispora leptoticha]
MSRYASHAGSWYTENASVLNEQLSEWLEEVPPTTEKGVPIPVKGARAIIAPHAGYSYSGPSAAYAYKCIDIEAIKRVFILGPSHHIYLPNCALSRCTEYETPFGNLILDTEVIGELRDTGHFADLAKKEDEAEHSIEMHLPYLYKTFESKINSIKIVPILVGALSTSQEQFYGRLLSRYLADPNNFFIISSDFCHWGLRFQYTYYSDDSDLTVQLTRKSKTELTIPIYQSIENLDRQGMSIIEHIDHQEFVSYLSKTRNTICGRHPIAVLVCALQELQTNTSTPAMKTPEIRFIHYKQSKQVTDVLDSSVSYASAYVYLP